MSRRLWAILLSGLAVTTMAAAFLGLPARAAPASTGQFRSVASSVAMPMGGTGHATAKTVDVRRPAALPPIAPHAVAAPPLGINGVPAGADLPVLPTRGHRPAPPGQPRIATGMNARGSTPATLPKVPPRTPPSTINSSFNSSVESNCGCIPSDSNATVGPSNIVETPGLHCARRTGLRTCQSGGHRECRGTVRHGDAGAFLTGHAAED